MGRKKQKKIDLIEVYNQETRHYAETFAPREGQLPPGLWHGEVCEMKTDDSGEVFHRKYRRWVLKAYVAFGLIDGSCADTDLVVVNPEARAEADAAALAEYHRLEQQIDTYERLERGEAPRWLTKDR